MFFERDYILRMIQMMGDFFRRLTDMMSDMDRARAIDGECQKRCGMTFSAARGLSADSLIELLPSEARFVMSELCYIASQAAPLGEEEELRYKSLRLLASLHRDRELCAARAARLAEIKEALLPRLTAMELCECARFFSEGESYAEMEDAIFQAADAAATGELGEVVDRGLWLLDGAAEATSEALALCGMTRGELRQSSEALRALKQFTIR